MKLAAKVKFSLEITSKTSKKGIYFFSGIQKTGLKP